MNVYWANINKFNDPLFVVIPAKNSTISSNNFKVIVNLKYDKNQTYIFARILCYENDTIFKF